MFVSGLRRPAESEPQESVGWARGPCSLGRGEDSGSLGGASTGLHPPAPAGCSPRGSGALEKPSAQMGGCQGYPVSTASSWIPESPVLSTAASERVKNPCQARVCLLLFSGPAFLMGSRRPRTWTCLPTLTPPHSPRFGSSHGAAFVPFFKHFVMPGCPHVGCPFLSLSALRRLAEGPSSKPYTDCCHSLSMYS